LEKREAIDMATSAPLLKEASGASRKRESWPDGSLALLRKGKRDKETVCLWLGKEGPS